LSGNHEVLAAPVSVAPWHPVARTALALFALSVAACDGCNKGSSSAPDAGVPDEPMPMRLLGPADANAPYLRDGGTLNVTPVPTASVEAILNPDKLPEYKGPTGSVEGTITVTGDPAPATPADFSRCPDAEQTWGHAFREGPRLPGGGRPLADSIVAVTGYKGFYLPEKDEAKEIRIEGCAYNTRTITVTFGERLEVKNLSKEFWSPKLEPGPSMVQMMAVPSGDPVKLYPKHPGPFFVVDHDRKFAIVDGYAFAHPLHTASSITGYYRIDGLPVGKVTVSTTHPHIAGSVAEADLEVKAGVVHKVDLVLSNVKREAGGPPSDAGTGKPSGDGKGKTDSKGKGSSAP
jgi:hypothetical protein